MVFKEPWTLYRLYSLLDFTVGVVPVTTVDASFDIIPDRPKQNMLESTAYKYYVPAVMQSLPVGIQVATGRFQEEKTLAIMSAITNVSSSNVHHKLYIAVT